MVFDGPAVFTPSTPCFPGDLRDWFAGQALAGSAGNSREMEYFEYRAEQEERTTIAVLAEHSYMIADAMLKQREESND